MKKTKVYIAGPYSSEPGRHTHNAVKLADCLLSAGYVPFIPHLSHFWHTISPKKYQAWLDYDFEWIPVCDALLRIAGDSPGADAEVEHANANLVPVYFAVPNWDHNVTVKEFNEWYQSNWNTNAR